MNQMPSGFTISVYNNKFRLPSDRRMHAVVAVGAQDANTANALPDAAEVILVDSSGSMDYPANKMVAARRATRAAIEMIRDGVRFAVVAGTESTRMVFPPYSGLVVADAETRSAACTAVRRLRPGGGTAMGSWLATARQLLADRPAAIRHALLFTDGRNQHETAEQLTAVLADCAGAFTCDARGIGTDYQPAEVLRIVTALGGQADAVRDYDDLAADLRAIMARSMDKRVGGVTLRIRTVSNTRVRTVRQTYPSRVDLADRMVVSPDGNVVEIETDSWGDEHREYLLGLDIDATGRELGRDSLAARVDVVMADAEPSKPGVVMLHWTEDAVLSVAIPPPVATVTGEQRMGEAIDAACAALRLNDTAVAEREFGDAVRLAHEFGNEDVLRRLGRLVDIADAANGVVRIRTDSELVDVFSAEMASVMSSTRVDDEPADAPPAGVLTGADPVCPECGHAGRPGDRWCEACRAGLGGDV